MLKSHEKYYSESGKRQVLVVDDEIINREMLGFMLASDYNVLYAEDGEDALQKIRENSHTLSLVLLDLMMPKIDGFQLMEIMRKDPDLEHIPFIVLTSERSAEVASLRSGASDFIAKPFEQPEVILARIKRTIELAEDKDIIQNTERDPLTSLFNREFFYRYVEQYDMHHPGQRMDAVALNINHFHLLNELYGWDYGDHVLSAIGNKVRELMAATGGIAGRMDADSFLLYYPSGADYAAMREMLGKGLLEGKATSSNKVRVRIGVYTDVDRDVKIERRFDRAKEAGKGTDGGEPYRKPGYGCGRAAVPDLLSAEIRHYGREARPVQRRSAGALAAPGIRHGESGRIYPALRGQGPHPESRPLRLGGSGSADPPLEGKIRGHASRVGKRIADRRLCAGLRVEL